VLHWFHRRCVRSLRINIENSREKSAQAVGQLLGIGIPNPPQTPLIVLVLTRWGTLVSPAPAEHHCITGHINKRRPAAEIPKQARYPPWTTTSTRPKQFKLPIPIPQISAYPDASRTFPSCIRIEISRVARMPAVGCTTGRWNDCAYHNIGPTTNGLPINCLWVIVGLAPG
jgi:hypothetical protein